MRLLLRQPERPPINSSARRLCGACAVPADDRTGALAELASPFCGLALALALCFTRSSCCCSSPRYRLHLAQSARNADTRRGSGPAQHAAIRDAQRLHPARSDHVRPAGLHSFVEEIFRATPVPRGEVVEIDAVVEAQSITSARSRVFGGQLFGRLHACPLRPTAASHSACDGRVASRAGAMRARADPSNPGSAIGGCAALLAGGLVRHS